MAVRTLPEPVASAPEDAPRGLALPLGGLVLGLSLPLIFLHVDFQPDLTLTLGGLSGSADLSDLAVLVLGGAALVVALRTGFGPLRRGWPVWLASAGFLAVVAAATFYPLLLSETYHWKSHLPTTLKFAEYALIALAVPLLVRARADAYAMLAALASWGVAATVVGFIQFFGWRILEAYPAGRRQPSFLGHHDFAGLSGALLAVALVAIALPSWRLDRRVVVASGVAGALGLVLSGSTAGALGIAAATIAAALIAWRRIGLPPRRALALAAIAGAVAGGVLLQRSGDFDQLLRSLGIRHKRESGGVQTYVQRALLVYIGWHIFLDHPIVGTGWQASGKEPTTYQPYLTDAHREFPHAPAIAFPSPAHPWGIQNAYVQALADLGVIGFVVFMGVFAAGVWTAGRPALRGPPETAALATLAGAWLLVARGGWTAVGLVAGIPLDGLTWLALGLAAAAAAGAAGEPA